MLLEHNEQHVEYPLTSNNPGNSGMNYNSDDACSNDSFGVAAEILDGDMERLVQGPQPNPDLHGLDAYFNANGEEPTISKRPFPAQPRTIKLVQVPKTKINHSYRDFTNMPTEATYAFPVAIDQMTFHERLYHMLTLHTAQRCLAIDWCCCGRAFHILNADYLEHLGILRCYFGFNTVQRFRKQLSNYGYKLLVGQSSSECYYSEVRYLEKVALFSSHFFCISFCFLDCHIFSSSVHPLNINEGCSLIQLTNQTLSSYRCCILYLETADHWFLKRGASWKPGGASSPTKCLSL